MMGNKTRNRIQSFWKRRLTKAEAKDLLDKLDGQQTALQQQLKTEFDGDSDCQELLSPEQSHKLLQAIRSKAGKDTPVKKMYPYRWVSAAAVVVLLSALGIFYNRQDTQVARETVYTQVPLFETDAVISHQDSLRYVLGDGSVVVLSPHSAIHYGKDYGIHNRSIQLIGEGKFTVQQDSILPFEVIANGFTTTALGTEFIIDGRTLDKTTVHLLSGKVVIRSTKEARMPIQDIYLAAGEMLYIDEVRKTTVRNPAVTPKSTGQSGMLDRRIANIHTNLRFDKNDLLDVIRQLSVKFDTRILIDPEVPRNLTFTGEFSADDDLETILHTICLVNDLEHDRGDVNDVVIRLKDAVYNQKTDTIEIE